MGYFKRKLDRRRAGDEVRALNEQEPDASLLAAWEALPARPPATDCLLRFSVSERHEDSGRRMGIFRAAGRASERTETPAETRRAIEEALGWFNEHLRVPRGIEDERVLFFFKSGATDCVRRVWDLVHALAAADLRVEMQRLRRPGRVVYEDEHQVAVVPWGDVETA